MDRERIKQAIQLAGRNDAVRIEIIKPASIAGQSLGVFASSFNPVTCAHLELMIEAGRQYRLDSVLALAGTANADKSEYDCDIEDRVLMLLLATSGSANAGVGICSTAFFVDMIDPLRALFPDSEIYFIVGY